MAQIRKHTPIIALTLGIIAAALFSTLPNVLQSKEPEIPGTSQTFVHKPNEKALVKALAASISYCQLGRLDLYSKYGRTELLNAVRHLAPSGDANAECVVGWLFEHGEMRTNPSVMSPGVIDGLYEYHEEQIDREMARQWYEKALLHGSAQAATRIAQYEEDPQKRIELLRLAVARGDDDAKVELGTSLESTDSKESVRLYEQAVHAKNRNTVDSALLRLLLLWHKQNIKPTPEFRGQALTAFELARKYNPNLSHTDFAHFFEFHGCMPEPYDELRWNVLCNIRKGCGLHSDCLEVGS